ncbi:hypothetical protein GGTG_03100 [Gaeumannomyces tritici R3-111a-1]|uniref:Uncharacterized protein n=1 Tax=Gaeumannomyces tritici (strain R3-111a-1) TaxID=644352 RepID=J3NP94_GAET3|nr:hypothetical protein GGTG_03100 [Gaeumannomyces tritici R3-111a-1]EJT77997.1 hypothetical protein GGTG_03100 [Gaeumannomyces tritici R3-111a-1]
MRGRQGKVMGAGHQKEKGKDGETKGRREKRNTIRNHNGWSAPSVRIQGSRPTRRDPGHRP